MTPTRKPSLTTAVLSIKRFPRSLLQHFKAKCALRGVTIKTKLEELVKAWIEDQTVR